MPILPIVLTGDPVLHTPAAPVEDFDDELEQLIDDMIETMHAAPGVGLAAPQVGVSRRVFVWHWEDSEGLVHKGVAVNPTLWISAPPVGPADEDEDSEGCLSIPGERFPLRRGERALLIAQGPNGQRYELEASGWLARILQHEADHLDGILYADRLEHPHAKAVGKAIRREGWGRPGKSWLPGVDNLDDLGA